MPTRTAVRELLGLGEPRDVTVALDLGATWPGDGFVRQQATFTARDGDVVPGFLFLPTPAIDPDVPRPGVLVHHQHASQWHLGKSEVAGLTGDPLQAFGPALAQRGIVVLAADSLGFEDRRGHAEGIERHPDDSAGWGRQLTHRLVRGDTLARKVLADAEDALLALRSVGGVAPERVGVAGHSYGGNVTIFQAAIDDRVAFACTSGAAGTYREKLARNIGIDLFEVVPGIADRLDIDDLLSLVVPRPLYVLGGSDDRYAADISDVVETVSAAYADAGAAAAFRGEVHPGSHQLDPRRHDAIVGWLTAAAAA